MARSLAGPWLAPAQDTFDGRAFYAAKTAAGAAHRYLFGWNPTREEQRDYRPWHWGGSLVVHEVAQGAGASLVVGPPEGIMEAFGREVPLIFTPRIGDCTLGTGGVTVAAPGSFGCATGGAMPDECRIDARITAADGTRSCGLLLRASEDLEAAYYIRLEPQRNRLVFDSWPRACDIPHMVELERPLSIVPGEPIDVTVFIDGTLCEVYAAGAVAMSARLYNLAQGDWGVFAGEGTATFDNLALSLRTGQ
jgi:beta-fructofuranosidase